LGIKKIAILGATGSIGNNAIAVLKDLPEEYKICALTTHTRAGELIALAKELRPDYLGFTGCEMADVTDVPKGTRCGFGKEALIEACEGADMVLLSVVGIAGLPAFEYCLKNRIAVALATKEAMVCGGRLARALMDETKTPVLPLDSELSAIFQCLQGNRKEDVRTVWLTASGGPFREWTMEQMLRATPDQAVNHPNWKMGAKISVDCATMINKGLEIIETHWFFNIPAENIRAVVHPQSIVHSMVEYIDSSVMAQMAVPDMKLAIHYALCYPKRVVSNVAPLDLFKISKLSFMEADLARFPCLELAYEAIRRDGSLETVLNSANEVAVDLFLKRRIGFMDIPKLIEKALHHFDHVKFSRFDEIYHMDAEVRKYVSSAYLNLKRSIISL